MATLAQRRRLISKATRDGKVTASELRSLNKAGVSGSVLERLVKNNKSGASAKSQLQTILGGGRGGVGSRATQPIRDSASLFGGPEDSGIVSKEIQAQVVPLLKQIGFDGSSMVSGADLQLIFDRIDNLPSGDLTDSNVNTAKGLVAAGLDQEVFDKYLSNQANQISDFTKDLLGAISGMQASQDANLASQLESIKSFTMKSEQRTTDMLKNNTAQMTKLMTDQRNQFDRQNALSEKNIENMMGQIATLSRPDQVGQAAQLQGVTNTMGSFNKIGLNRRISTIGQVADIGLNQSQVASQKRQQQGVSGFRSKKL